MNLLKIAISSFGTLIALFLFTKILGNRQMSQLSMYDYVSSVTIGSIAGEMSILSSDSFLEPLVAMAVFSILTYFISFITCKSITLRRFFEGHALLLYQDGQVYEKNLLKAKLDIDELLSSCRLSGYFDLEEIHTIYLESNGMLSILPKAISRPVIPKDMNLEPEQSLPLANIIIDGKILTKILNIIGKNETWVYQQLKKHGIKNIEEVILASYDPTTDSLNIYMKFHRKMIRDIFE